MINDSVLNFYEHILKDDHGNPSFEVDHALTILRVSAVFIKMAMHARDLKFVIRELETVRCHLKTIADESTHLLYSVEECYLQDIQDMIDEEVHSFPAETPTEKLSRLLTESKEATA